VKMSTERRARNPEKQQEIYAGFAMEQNKIKSVVETKRRRANRNNTKKEGEITYPAATHQTSPSPKRFVLLPSTLVGKWADEDRCRWGRAALHPFPPPPVRLQSPVLPRAHTDCYRHKLFCLLRPSTGLGSISVAAGNVSAEKKKKRLNTTITRRPKKLI
jgi:hypothetical protein